MSQEAKQEKKYVPAEYENVDNYLSAIRYLTVNKIPYADKTPFGGALWVFIDDPASKKVADLAAASGLKFIFTEKGGSASHNKPAWYYRASGKSEKNKDNSSAKEGFGIKTEVPSIPDSAANDFILEQPETPRIDKQKPNKEWIWPAVDESCAKRALNISSDSIHMDDEKKEASIEGSPDRKTGKSTTYVVTLTRCSCQDFNINNKREKPCKHIVRLGMELGIINNNGLTPEQQREKSIIELKDKIARAAGYYYIFNSPICADNMYDRMKERLAYLEREI